MPERMQSEVRRHLVCESQTHRKLCMLQKHVANSCTNCKEVLLAVGKGLEASAEHTQHEQQLRMYRWIVHWKKGWKNTKGWMNCQSEQTGSWLTRSQTLVPRCSSVWVNGIWLVLMSLSSQQECRNWLWTAKTSCYHAWSGPFPG